MCFSSVHCCPVCGSVWKKNLILCKEFYENGIVCLELTTRSMTNAGRHVNDGIFVKMKVVRGKDIEAGGTLKVDLKSVIRNITYTTLCNSCESSDVISGMEAFLRSWNVAFVLTSKRGARWA